MYLWLFSEPLCWAKSMCSCMSLYFRVSVCAYCSYTPTRVCVRAHIHTRIHTQTHTHWSVDSIFA